MKQLIYRNKSIGSIASLAKAVGFPADQLIRIAGSANVFYLPNPPKVKPSGKIRQTYSVKEPLHTLQENILREIISGVDFPEYLQGSVKDKDSPRDYICDAKLHAGRKVLLKEDISNFFSSIRSPLVNRVWKYFFKFPDDVADLLTKLTTYNNFVPEGAPTSPAIANLVFWDKEPLLEHEFRQKGYVYSRYVDDISVSFVERICKEELNDITGKIYGMFIGAGVKPNREKRRVQNRSGKMSVHKLNINSGRPTIPQPERNKIRVAVKELEDLSLSVLNWDGIKQKYEEVNDRVNLLSRLHPREAQPYLERLESIRKKYLSN